MRTISTPLVPGVSVIELTQKSGVFSLSLTRHWADFPRNEHGSPNCRRVEPCVPWYRLVMRAGDVVHELPCPRHTAAQLLSAELRLEQQALAAASEEENAPCFLHGEYGCMRCTSGADGWDDAIGRCRNSCCFDGVLTTGEPCPTCRGCGVAND